MPLAAALPYIALGASAAGTGLSIAGNEASQSAMNAARANEVNQQAALQKQSNAIFQNSLAQSTPQTAQQQMQQGQAARTNAWQGLQDATTPVASALPTTTSGSTTGSSTTGGGTSTGAAGTPTSGASARAASAGNSWNTLLANAAAREGSYGDWQNQQAIKNANAAQQLGVVNNFSQGDAALLPTELQVASQAGDSLSGWGNIVSSLGSLAGYANKSGIFGGTTPAVTPADAASVSNWGNGSGLYDSIASGSLPSGTATTGMFGLPGMSAADWAGYNPASAGISKAYNYPMTNAMLSGSTYQPAGNVWAGLNQ